MDEFHPEFRDSQSPPAISLATDAALLADDRRRGRVNVRQTGAVYDLSTVRQLTLNAARLVLPPRQLSPARSSYRGCLSPAKCRLRDGRPFSAFMWIVDPSPGPLGVANICQARIGDTLKEAIERYGKPLHKASADEFAMFKEASYYITAHFHNAKTDTITYVKTGFESSTKGAFSDDEVQMLLKSNGNGQNQSFL